MQFLTISQRIPGSSDEALVALREDESRRARALYLEGSLRQVWHRDDIPGAALLWEAESEAQVRAMLSTLPFVMAGLIELTIIPLKPYSGFGPGPEISFPAGSPEKAALLTNGAPGSRA